ncbi:MFS transporter [Evtepia sp.]|uniref:MFS transporter n=1 Tax=Evtepia sp. TaxID=2773933 RepID=UPI002A81E3D0|nr:MFS transporter [Evtepia sp.]MDY4429846.1 MFS transporter [Evtepia sp.]
MSPKSSGKGIYHGWWIVITCLALMALIFVPLTNLPGLFTVFITEEFGITRTAFTTHITISTLTSMAAALFVGRLYQHHSPRLLMAVSTVIIAACFLGYSLAGSVVHFYVISAIIGFFGMFLTSVPISILINNWFGPKMKGKAMGIAMMGSGLGAMVLNPLFTSINTRFGWRMSYRLAALLAVAVILPLVLLTVVRAPEDKGLTRIGEAPNAAAAPSGEVTGLTVGQALRSSIFWSMAVTFFLFSATATIINTNAIPYMTDVGLDPVTAAQMMSLSALGVIIGKLILGAVSDKWGVKPASTAAILCLLVGMVCFLGVEKTALLAPVATFVFGLGNANATVIMPLLASDMIGNRDFGTIFGYASLASALGASAAPLFGSLIYDSTGSYAAAWVGNIVLIAVSLVGLYLCYRLRPGVYRKLGLEGQK